MTVDLQAVPDVTRDLGDGLLLRRATPADIPVITELMSRVFAFRGQEQHPNVGAWIDDLASGRHPTVTAEDFLFVADTRAGDRPVAGLVLMSQEWELDGVRFGVGRPELVATLAEYRDRGLQRALFGAAHTLCAARNQPVQGITGIYYYYRQFGYEYALDLGYHHGLPLALVPPVESKPNEPPAAELCTLRPATPDDLGQIMRLYEQQRAGRLVSTVRDEAYTRWIVFEQRPDSSEIAQARMIVDPSGRSLGYLSYVGNPEDPVLFVIELAVEPGVGLRPLMPALLRALQAEAAGIRTCQPEPKPLERLLFMLHREHPVYRAIPHQLVLQREPYAWYVRVADLPAFLLQLAPVLERRLADSIDAGYTGELKLSFFRSGLRLRFDGGRLVESAPWLDRNDDEGTTGYFPPHTFLQLVFGHRTAADLRTLLPDARVKDTYAPLVETLFPRRASWALPLP
jgi:GNAT superfamily N-acetyltransferase